MKFSRVTDAVHALTPGQRLSMGIALSVLAGFWFSNWYWSPPERLDRLAKSLVYPMSAQLASAGDKVLASTLRPLGGGKDIDVDCGSRACTVRVRTRYDLDGGNSGAIELEVSVRVTPNISAQRHLFALPPRIWWQQEALTWWVRVLPPGSHMPSKSLGGDIRDLARLEEVDSHGVLRELTSALARQLAERLAGDAEEARKSEAF